MVDDGSDTECSQVLKRLERENTNMMLQVHLINRGKGAAIKTGISMAGRMGRMTLKTLRNSEESSLKKQWNCMTVPLKNWREI